LHAQSFVVFYRVERTYLQQPGDVPQKNDLPHYVSGDSACSVASVFVNQDGARLIGGVSDLPGDKATATASRDGRVYVVFVQRGDEAPLRPAR